jgi:hypothetical protein
MMMMMMTTLNREIESKYSLFHLAELFPQPDALRTPMTATSSQKKGARVTTVK